MKTETFIKRSRIDAPVGTVFKWHSRHGALERLSSPWDPIQVIERTGGIHKGARAVLKMKAGPVPYQWIAEHTDYEENRLFRDRQVKGPLASWVHTHTFEPDGEAASFLEDRIEYALLFHPFGNFFAGEMVRQKLESIFHFRHTTTKQDIAAHLSRADKKPLNVLISGASGVVGSAMIPFLTTGGHRVVSLVRKISPYAPASRSQTQFGNDSKSENRAVFWNPASNVLDPDSIQGIDTVIHLAGENIGEGKWTTEKKRRIIESRTKGTALIANTIAKLNPPPKVMICASAVGYYGHRKDWILTEQDGPGNDFISEVCYKWEKAAAPAIEKGIRVVFMRIGIALTPAGGALQRLLFPFQMGVGGKIASGNQFMSWVSLDDVVGAIYHAINHEPLEGPVNLVSPNPITNSEFTEKLGKVLSRPAPFTVPAWAVKLAFGEMGKEILLSSTRVQPVKLLEAGYKFRHSEFEDALRYLLGKKMNGKSVK